MIDRADPLYLNFERSSILISLLFNHSSSILTIAVIITYEE